MSKTVDEKPLRPEYSRRGRMITNLTTGVTETFSSINRAKGMSRQIQMDKDKALGLGVLSTTPGPKKRKPKKRKYKHKQRRRK